MTSYLLSSLEVFFPVFDYFWLTKWNEQTDLIGLNFVLRAFDLTFKLCQYN